jgi:hypothetical protein
MVYKPTEIKKKPDYNGYDTSELEGALSDYNKTAEFQPLFTSLRNIYPSKFKTGMADEPFKVAKEVYEFANTNPQGFHQDLMTLGRTNDTVNLLKGFGAKDEQVDQLFGKDLTPETTVNRLFPELFKTPYEKESNPFIGYKKDPIFLPNTSEKTKQWVLNAIQTPKGNAIRVMYNMRPLPTDPTQNVKPTTENVLEELRKEYQQSPSSLPKKLYARGATPEDVKTLYGLLGIPEQAESVINTFKTLDINKRGGEDAVIGRLYPNEEPQKVIDRANADMNNFIDEVVAKGNTQDTQDMLRILGFGDTEIETLLFNSMPPEVAGEEPSMSIDEFTADYFKKQGYTDLPSTMGGTFNRSTAKSKDLPQADAHLKEATTKYREKFGDAAWLRSGAAKVAKTAGQTAIAGAMVNPVLGLGMAALGTTVSQAGITPETEKLSLSDWLGSGAQVALFGSPLGRGLGGVTGRATQTGLLGGATLAQSAATTLDWGQMSDLERVGSVAFTVLMGAGTAFSAKGLVNYASFRSKYKFQLPVKEQFFEDMYEPWTKYHKAEKELQTLQGNLAKETPAKVEALTKTMQENYNRGQQIVMDLKNGKYGQPEPIVETPEAQTQIPEELGVILRENGVEVPSTPQGAWAALFNLGKTLQSETGSFVPGAPIGGTGGKIPKEMNFTQFATSKKLPSDYDITDHSALSPSGHVSNRARADSIKALEKRIADNRVAHEEYRKAILSGEIIDPSGEITKEGMIAEQTLRTTKDIESQKQIILGHIKDIESYGKMSHKENGQLKIGYQRMVDDYNAQLKKLESPKPEPSITPVGETVPKVPSPEEIQWRFPTADDFYFWAKKNNLSGQQTNQLWDKAKEAKKILQGKKPSTLEPITPKVETANKIANDLTIPFSQRVNQLKELNASGTLSDEQFGKLVGSMQETTLPKTIVGRQTKLQSILDKYENNELTIKDVADSLRSTKNTKIRQAIFDYDEAVKLDREEYGMRSGLDNEAGDKLISTIQSETGVITPKTEQVVPKIEQPTEVAKEPTTMTQSGNEIAKQLGVKFDGTQEGIGMQFTDPQTGSTTYGNTLEEVTANLNKMRAKFSGEIPPEKPPTAVGVEEPPEEPIKPTQVQKVREFYKAKIADMEVTARDKIASLRDWKNYKIEEQVRIKGILTDYIQETLPLEERGKLLDAVKNVTTQKELDEVLDRVDKMAVTSQSKNLISKIYKEIAKTKTTNVEGIIKGKFGGDIQTKLNTIKANLKGNREEALTQISKNQVAYEEGKMSYEDMIEANTQLYFTGVDQMTPAELQDTLIYIQDLKATGRTARSAEYEKFKKQMETAKKDIVEVLTGGKPVEAGVVKERKGLVALLNKVENGQLALTDFLDNLSRPIKGKPYQSALNKFVDNRVIKSYNAEQDGLNKQSNQIRQAFNNIFKTKSGAHANDVLRQMNREKIELGKNAEGKPIVMTKGQMIDAYNLMQAEQNLPTFKEGNKFTPENMEAIKNKLTPQEKEWADWMREHLSEYWVSINEVYEPLYGVKLGRNDNYWPRNRDIENSDIPEQILMQEDYSHFASVNNGSLKARTNNKIPFKFLDANAKLISHITQMEHFKSWAFTIRDLRSLFVDKNIQNAIKQYHGKEVLRIINDYINVLARGGIEKSKRIHALDTLRGNVAVSVLGLKPMIAIKQPTALLAYAVDMPYTDFMGGIVDFLKNPVENYKALYAKSASLRARYRAGQYERDLKVGVEGGAIKSISGKAGWKENVLTLIQLGDKFGTVPGMWAKYKSSLKAGMSDADAILEAEKLTNRTQNTSALFTLSPLQHGGSWARLFTMFQDQPNKYFRLIDSNFKDAISGRGNRAKSISNLIILWVIIPALFQFMSDGFRWQTKRQLRAWLLGPVNNLLIFGSMAQSAVGWITGESYPYEPSPVLQIADDIKFAISKANKMVRDGLDPYKDISMDDVYGMIEYLAKGIGSVTGIPTPYIVQVEKAIRSGKPENLLFSEWSLKNDDKSNNDKASEEILKLGTEEPLTAEEELDASLTNREPKIVDMKKLDTRLSELYKAVLPSKIESDSPYVKSWVEKETVWGTAGTLPNVELRDLTKPDSSGDTITEYEKQWVERQRVTNLPDLKAFDKLYPNAYKGNITSEQSKLVKQYMALKTDREKTAFVTKNPLIKSNPRDEWLKSHPKENALLAVWSQSDVETIESYKAVRKLITELDIPENAINKKIPPQDIAELYFKYKTEEAKPNISSETAFKLVSRSTTPELSKKLGDWLEIKTTAPSGLQGTGLPSAFK